MSSSQAFRPANHAAIAKQTRIVFVTQVAQLLGEMDTGIANQLNTLFEQAKNAREAQDWRDALQTYKMGRSKWLESADRAWKNAAQTETTSSGARHAALSLELIGNEVVETKIVSSRLAALISEKAGQDFVDLQIRMRFLEDKDELGKNDILRPEICAQLLLDQWLAAKLSQEMWLSVQTIIQKSFSGKARAAYLACNEFLIAQGVMREIDLRSNVKRSPNSTVAFMQAEAAHSQRDSTPASLMGALQVQQSYGHTSFGGAEGFGHTKFGEDIKSKPNALGALSKAGNANSKVAEHIAKLRAQAAQFASQHGIKRPAAKPSTGDAVPAFVSKGRMQADRANAIPNTAAEPALAAPENASPAMRPGRAALAKYLSQSEPEESRLQTAATPLARARMRAQGVMGQLRNLLVQRVAGFENTQAPQMSPQLAAAMVQRPAVRTPGYGKQFGDDAGQGSEQYAQAPVYAGVSAQIQEGMQAVQVNRALREQTNELKKVADSDTEKATIEIVALMFQNILAEERIPPGVRVWFARLQMPVLRLALAEAEFFGALEHPARRLIDRMGSSVLGFDANVGSAQLEAEIKRVVQTIEQYPETGRRVFQLVLDEFEKFLDKFLSQGGTTAKVVTLAQQLEQKETAAIQYTIELRKMLGKLPLPDAVREFLFKVWAEVLALGAMKYGAQHEQTISLKQVAADLLWASSIKTGKEERAKLVADLPDLLKRLRLGMTMLGLSTAVQDGHIQALREALAEAFTSQSAAMNQSQVDDVAKRMRHLEDFFSEDDVGELTLDEESIELMLGIDMSGVTIINDGGSEPTQAMRVWAMELERASWFHLDFKGKMLRVQYAWRSERGQLFLFADGNGLTYLLQLKRLAAYLQAGLLAPVEDETLTTRATRAAYSKIDAQPERLLAA